MRPPIALLLLAALLTAGCAAARGPVSNGVSLEMEFRRGDDSIALFRVRPDDTIAYGGGRDAIQGRTTWSGPLTAEEAAELRTLLDDRGWFSPVPALTDAAADVAYRVSLAGPGGTARFSLDGESEAVVPVRGLLETAAARRLDPVLVRLPRPSAAKP